MCVCVCVGVCVCVCRCECELVCVPVWVWACVCAGGSVSLCVIVFVWLCVCVCVSEFVCVIVHLCWLRWCLPWCLRLTIVIGVKSFKLFSSFFFQFPIVKRVISLFCMTAYNVWMIDWWSLSGVQLMTQEALSASLAHSYDPVMSIKPSFFEPCRNRGLQRRALFRGRLRGSFFLTFYIPFFHPSLC